MKHILAVGILSALLVLGSAGAVGAAPELVSITHAPQFFDPAVTDITLTLVVSGVLVDDPPSVLLLAEEVSGGRLTAIPFGSPNFQDGAYRLHSRLDGAYPWALSFLVLNGALMPGADAHLQRFYFFRDFPSHPTGYSIYPTGTPQTPMYRYALPVARR